MNKMVILCTEDGTPTGSMDTLRAHREGHLHRAFSVFIFRKHSDELLLQKRSDQKALFPRLWANTCCSHPRPGESLPYAAERRLSEELGFTCPLHECGSFVYRAKDPEGKGIEHEYDTVFTGSVNRALDVRPDPQEVSDWRWTSIAALQKELEIFPHLYAPWLAQSLDLALQEYHATV